MGQQDDQLDMIGTSVGVLKNMSHQIGNELDEQAVWVCGGKLQFSFLFSIATAWWNGERMLKCNTFPAYGYMY